MAVEAARIVINIDTNAAKASRSMNGLSQNTRKAGQSADAANKAFSTMKAIGLAAIAATAARAVGRLAGSLVSAASDAEETANKFGVTFRGINDEAERTAQSLADNFGLAQDQAQALLADTGDLLSGFGFTAESALDLSTQVNELAVDLASFTNFSGGAAGASAALTKALLGERESIKSLGIAITEADIARLAEEKGIVGELTRQQKAMLTLELATRQSANAIGDFARSQDSFANQTRILDAAVRDLSVEFGQALLPVATDLVGVAREVVGWFGDLDEATKQNIVTAAAFVAGLAAVTAGVYALVVAVGALAANPIVLGIAGVAGAIGGIAVAVDRARAADADDLMDSIAGDLERAKNSGEDMVTAIAEISRETGVSAEVVTALADEHGLISNEMREQLTILQQQREAAGTVGMSAREAAKQNKRITEQLQQQLNFGADVTDLVADYAAGLGISLDRAIELAKQTDNITDEQIEQLNALEESVDATQSAAAAELERAANASSYGQARERAAAAAEAEAEAAEVAAQAEAEKTRQLEMQQRINDAYLAARGEVLAILDSEQTELERIQSQIDYLNEHPWAAGGMLEADRIEAVRILRDRMQEIIEAQKELNAEAEDDEDTDVGPSPEEIARSERLLDLRREIAAFDATEIERLEQDRVAALEEAYGTERDLINEIYDLKREQYEENLKEAELERVVEYNEQIMEEERARIEAINEASREAAEARIELAEEERERVKAIREQQRDDTLAILDETASAMQAFTEFRMALIDRELAAMEAQGASEEQISERRKELLREQARREKAVALFSAIVNTAQAVVKALASAPPPYSYVLAGIAAAAGAIQIGTIVAQPLPQAQFGGSFVVPPGNNDDSGLLRVNSGEEVNVTPARQTGQQMPDTIVVRIGDAAFDARVERAFNKGSAQIRRRGAVQVNR